MSVNNGGEGDKGGVVMSGGGGPCVGSGWVSNKDCCRLPGIIRELWEDLPYSFPFFFSLVFDFFFNNIFLPVALEKKGSGGGETVS